jgi:hypothetical protein
MVNSSVVTLDIQQFLPEEYPLEFCAQSEIIGVQSSLSICYFVLFIVVERNRIGVC